jgi:hypothetical protein
VRRIGFALLCTSLLTVFMCCWYSHSLLLQMQPCYRHDSNTAQNRKAFFPYFLKCLPRLQMFKIRLVTAVPWLRRLDAGLWQRKHGFDFGSVHVGFVVDELELGQVSPRVFQFFPVNFILPALHYTKKLIISTTGLHNKPQGCRASVASAAGPFSAKKIVTLIIVVLYRAIV